MRLSALDPRFLRAVTVAPLPAPARYQLDSRTAAQMHEQVEYHWCDSATAQVLRFRCPACRPFDPPHGITVNLTENAAPALTTDVSGLSLVGDISCSCGWSGRIVDGGVTSTSVTAPNAPAFRPPAPLIADLSALPMLAPETKKTEPASEHAA